MNHDMRLFPKNFQKVKSGQKQREYRLHDEKRRRVKVGDTITFFDTESNESLVVKVTNIKIFPDFKSCYRQFWKEDFEHLYSDINQAIEETYRYWWSKEQEAKYGCVVFEIQHNI